MAPRAYVYRAALLCESCGDHVRATKPRPAHVNEADEPSYDSDDWPKGPYENGGGEADSPQHCDCCGLFLENPLTADGEAYVREACAGAVMAEWREFYAYLWEGNDENGE